MIIPTVGRLDAITRRYDASSRMMSASNAMLNMLSSPGFMNQNPSFLAAMETRWTLNMLQNNLLYKLSLQQEKAYEKMAKENAKTFSTFA